jgi:cytochrome d ubiquinol oxidase subunit II
MAGGAETPNIAALPAIAMFLVLFALILRPVGFKYRSKREGITWRRNWDWALFVGGAVPALIFGVAVGNALEGVLH